jgi:hypothetical protein
MGAEDAFDEPTVVVGLDDVSDEVEIRVFPGVE